MDILDGMTRVLGHKPFEGTKKSGKGKKGGGVRIQEEDVKAEVEDEGDDEEEVKSRSFEKKRSMQRLGFRDKTEAQFFGDIWKEPVRSDEWDLMVDWAHSASNWLNVRLHGRCSVSLLGRDDEEGIGSSASQHTRCRNPAVGMKKPVANDDSGYCEEHGGDQRRYQVTVNLRPLASYITWIRVGIALFLIYLLFFS